MIQFTKSELETISTALYVQYCYYSDSNRPRIKGMSYNPIPELITDRLRENQELSDKLDKISGLI